MQCNNVMKWKEVKDSYQNFPKERHGHRCIAYGKYMIVLGGGNEGILSDVNIFNTENNKWFIPGVVGTIYLGIAAYGVVLKDSDLIIFGGVYHDGSYSNDIYMLKLFNWTFQTLQIDCDKNTELPCPRLGHSFTISSTHQIYMFGGLTSKINEDNITMPCYLNDLYILKQTDSNKMKWTLVKTRGKPPVPRESHSAIIYNYHERETLIIYGGMCGKRLGDIHFFDIETLVWSQPVILGPQPPPRSLHVSGVCHNKMIVFGGWIPSDTISDNIDTSTYCESDWRCTNNVSILNLEILSWETVNISENSENAPKPRAGHCGCIINDRLYIWSGRDGFRKSWNDQVCCSDLWYLETSRAEPPSRLYMDGNDTCTVGVRWDPIDNADFYLVQIMKVGANTICNSSDVKSIIERNIKNQKKDLSLPKVPQLPALKLVASPFKGSRLDSSLTPIQKLDDKPEKMSNILQDRNINESSAWVTQNSSIDANDITSRLECFDKPYDKNISYYETNDSFNDFKPDSQLTKNEPTVFSEFMSRLPPLGVTLPQKTSQTVPNTPILAAKKYNAFNDIPIGRWFESVIVSEPKVCVAQFYIDMGGDKYRTNVNRRSIPLEPNYTYRLRVASVNSCGIGEFSPPLSFSTTAPGLPGPPTDVKVIKRDDEIYLTWSSVGEEENLEFSVYISMPLTSTTQIPLNIKSLKFIYEKIYQGKECQCILNPHISEDFELGDSEKSYLMLRIVAKNQRGYGPVTQIKWYKDEYTNSTDNKNPSSEKFYLPLKKTKTR